MKVQQIHFGCTALKGTNKGGVLKPDQNGYFTVVLGGFDTPNMAGAIYPLSVASAHFKEGSGFMRRLRAGYARGEYGHPKRQPGSTMEEFLNRLCIIEETRICMHIADVWIDPTFKDASGRTFTAVIGKIKPEGPYGQYLLESLLNPQCNVAFSIRTLCRDRYVGGRLFKDIVEMVGWDFVVEPGIQFANKYQAPGLESFAMEDLLDIPVSVGMLAKMANNPHTGMFGLESSGAGALLRDCVQRLTRAPTPRSSLW